MDTEAATAETPAPAYEAEVAPAAPVTEAAAASEAEAKIDEWTKLWLKYAQSTFTALFLLFNIVRNLIIVNWNIHVMYDYFNPRLTIKL